MGGLFTQTNFAYRVSRLVEQFMSVDLNNMSQPLLEVLQGLVSAASREVGGEVGSNSAVASS